jgi:endonuclease-8
MPEGDTVRKLAGLLETYLQGRSVWSVRLRARRSPALAGTVLGVRAHGKQLWIDFDHGHSLHCHLGLYGSWHRYRPGERWRKPARQAGVEIHLDDQVIVCFNPRAARWTITGGIAERDVAATLGPDLSREPVDLAEAVRRARQERGERLLADVLLDQRIAAGIGNAYKSELLFLRRLRPDVRVGRLAAGEIRALYQLAGELIRANLDGGPRTTQFLSDRADRLWVYGRYDEPCSRCATRIRMVRLGEDLRSTYWCPQCQGGEELAGDLGCGRHTVKASCR